MLVPSEGVVNFCNWLQNTPYALAIAGSTWAYPFVQTTHFTGLSIWLGTSLAVDFRLLGWLGRSHKPSELARSLFAWNWIGFAIAVIGGASLFSTDAVAFSHAERTQTRRQPTYFRKQLIERERSMLAGLTLPNECLCIAPAGKDVLVQTVV